jgi:hypothetical protein
MNRRRTLLFVIVGLALACGVVLLSGSRKPLAKLRIVRFAVEQGKSVVYFRVETEKNRFVEPPPYFKNLEDGTTEEFLIRDTNGLFVRAPNFFAASQDMEAWMERIRTRKEFGVIAPTNSTVWKLRLRVELEELHSFNRVLDMLRLGTHVGQIHFKSIFAAAKWLWNEQRYTHEEIVESDPITNSVVFSRPTF